MKVTVRNLRVTDRAAWAEMRAALWPDETPEAHANAIEQLLGNSQAWGFIAETHDGRPVGFAEIVVRPYANGCEAQPVPFLEGIWVSAAFRRQGVAARMLEHAETFLGTLGFRELGSDTQIDNRASQAAHIAWGFTETERVVYFRKTLPATTR